VIDPLSVALDGIAIAETCMITPESGAVREENWPLQYRLAGPEKSDEITMW
jgi:hypothetical protein